ncbi:MAG: hypothetical protein FWG30_08305 [Eubacteriaceae bacterium]|nr:hypothetical protein [Eubacteriaceae bacterium]
MHCGAEPCAAWGEAGESRTTEEKRIVKPEELASMGGKLLLYMPYGHCMVKKAPYYGEKAFTKGA